MRGQSYDALAAMLDQDRAEALMQVNFFSLTRIAKSLVRGMIRARAGRIVAIGSVAALRANTGNAAYAATKGALIAYCRTLAIESAKRGVTVNVIAPGFIDTADDGRIRGHRTGMERQIPAGRFAAPAEVAALAAFLMAEPAAYITGTVLPGRWRPDGDAGGPSLMTTWPPRAWPPLAWPSLACLLLSLAAARAEPAPYRIDGLPPGETLSIRAEPDPSAEIVGEIRARALVVGCTNETPSRTDMVPGQGRPHASAGRGGATSPPRAALMRRPGLRLPIRHHPAAGRRIEDA